MFAKSTARAALLAGFILSAAFAQIGAAQVPMHPGPVTGPGAPSKHPKQEPCWQVAGVSKAAIQQRRTVTQQARQQVEAVCSSASLDPQQKRQQIQQIHERERQEIDGIITPQQREAMHSCQEGRSSGHGGGHGGGGGGPCGEISTGHKPNPPAHPFSEDEEDEAPSR